MAKLGYGIENLNAWQKALELAVFINKELVPRLPKEERYALVDQLRRSAQSIPANIAEGYGRYYYQDNIRFCYIARGSLEETHSHLVLARKMGYFPVELLDKVDGDIAIIRKLINGYITYLKTEKPGCNEPGSTVREGMPPYIVSGDTEE